MTKYSIVIPVYNSEKYLEECVKSVLSQSFSDFEIILVDDGSTDSSVALCDSLSKADCRIKVKHKENGGASSARNVGICLSSGEFILFLDSDDYWNDKDLLLETDKLFQPGVDIVVFPSVTYYESDNRFVEDRYNYSNLMNELSPEECIKYMIGHDLFNVHPGKKAFRKDFLMKNNLFFKEGIRAEDIELYLRVVDYLPKCKFLNKKMYVYRQHEGSVTATAGGKHLSEHLEIIENYSKKEYFSEGIQSYIRSYLAYSLGIVIAHTMVVRPDNQKELLNRAKKLCWLYKYNQYPRTRKIALVYRVFGFRCVCILLGVYLGRNQ